MEIGLTLMIVGMVTVFVVLLIIINLSKLLIGIVNKVAPEEEVKHKTAPASAAIPPGGGCLPHSGRDICR